jgi:tRNA dimethylallyltransferase
MGEREQLYENINRRAAQMFEKGLITEIEKLLDLGFGRELKPMQAIGYRHGLQFLDGHWTREQALAMLARDTRHYAKRQLTWFRRDPEVVWFRPEQRRDILTLIQMYLGAS